MTVTKQGLEFAVKRAGTRCDPPKHLWVWDGRDGHVPDDARCLCGAHEAREVREALGGLPP